MVSAVYVLNNNYSTGVHDCSSHFKVNKTAAAVTEDRGIFFLNIKLGHPEEPMVGKVSG